MALSHYYAFLSIQSHTDKHEQSLPIIPVEEGNGIQLHLHVIHVVTQVVDYVFELENEIRSDCMYRTLLDFS